ncbi:hypothetical protein SEA_EVANESCE_26 [Mycobacterium phage Evanesce]|nr:minor tail protein [Mycobacterium phage Giles]ALA06670.1 minor tail subunit [Mycobacterium phage OBUpride]ALF00247.1 hypothetical protein SEA_EVANESCE_26 [Mycobacterium phage Evanesce]AXQ51458.1 hypothetical protein SEA_AMOCHICK_26 [Mycobacterium phage Amochick]QBQ71228.1 hypothetical protein SEA_DAEGAL_27 [Mycobacterium phage Daegal]WAA19483.1 hypothetical protein SEA_DEWEY_26 [Mycobacterium phage Dewey]WAB10136.1 hypothetical protein SEA_GRAVAILLIA_26 [Mycobacterium phage Gravaillia]
MRVQQVDVDMSGWCPVTRLYRTEDGEHIAVTVHDYMTANGSVAAFPATAEGFAVDLTPLWSTADAVTHEAALAMHGYILED